MIGSRYAELVQCFCIFPLMSICFHMHVSVVHHYKLFLHYFLFSSLTELLLLTHSSRLKALVELQGLFYSK